jgi:hypothetical protein
MYTMPRIDFVNTNRRYNDAASRIFARASLESRVTLYLRASLLGDMAQMDWCRTRALRAAREFDDIPARGLYPSIPSFYAYAERVFERLTKKDTKEICWVLFSWNEDNDKIWYAAAEIGLGVERINQLTSDASRSSIQNWLPEPYRSRLVFTEDGGLSLQQKEPYIYDSFRQYLRTRQPKRWRSHGERYGDLDIYAVAADLERAALDVVWLGNKARLGDPRLYCSPEVIE